MKEWHLTVLVPISWILKRRDFDEAALEINSRAARTKEEVLEAVQGHGYKFSTGNPLNSLGVILYGKNPKFNRVDGKFSLSNQEDVGCC